MIFVASGGLVHDLEVGGNQTQRPKQRPRRLSLFETYLLKLRSASPGCSSLINPKNALATLGIPIVTHCFITNSRRRLLRKRLRSGEAFSGSFVR